MVGRSLRLARKSRVGLFGLLGSLGSLAGPLALAAASPSLRVSEAWLNPPPPGAPTGAIYLTLENQSQAPQRVTGVSVEGASSSEIHETVPVAGGKGMAMRRLEALSLAPGETRRLAPGGMHVMVMGWQRALKPGDQVGVKVKLADGQELSTVATVK